MLLYINRMKVLDAYLTKNGITQRQFADRLGCSQGLISQWINGKTEMTGQWAVKIERETRKAVRRQDLLPALYRGMAV